MTRGTRRAARPRLTVAGWRAAGALVLPGKCTHRESHEFTALLCNEDIYWCGGHWRNPNGSVHWHAEHHLQQP